MGDSCCITPAKLQKKVLNKYPNHNIFTIFAGVKTIEIKNLCVGHIHAGMVAQDLCASADSGKLTCLLGRNGIGKSTLLKTISGFLPKMAGQVFLDGKEISTLTSAQRARLVSVVLSSAPAVSGLRVSEVVALGRTPFTGFWGFAGKTDKLCTAQAMQMTGIDGLANRYMNTLSDGERQKVMLAKALAQQTPIILLDEPTAYLDYPSKIEAMLLLRSLARQEGKTVLMSTHDVGLALQLADDIWLLAEDGKLHTGEPQKMVLDESFRHFIEQTPQIKLDADTLSIHISPQ